MNDEDPVLAHIDPLALLKQHAPVLERIRLAFGATASRFESDTLPLIERYAAYVHTLPAAPDGPFSNAGGLLELGLHTGLYSLQGADARIFTGHATITQRRDAEPRWRVAAFLAGLCCELHMGAHCTVYGPDGARWPQYQQPLQHWIARCAEAPCRVRWSRQAARPVLATALLPLVLAPEMLADLGADDGEVLAHLLACLAGLSQPGPPNPLVELSRSALTLVLAASRSSATALRRASSVPVEPLARIAVQGLRQLAAERADWQVDAPRAKTWWSDSALYMQWPDCALDLHQLLLDARVAGQPSQAKDWLEPLCGIGMVVGPPGGAVRMVTPGWSRQPLAAVRLAHPGWLLDMRRAWSPPARDATEEGSSGPEEVLARPQDRALSGSNAAPVLQAAAPAQSFRTEPPVGPHVPAPIHPPRGAAPSEDDATARWHLQAPMRLAPQVRQALAEILLDMQRIAQVRAWRLTDGLFIAADEWMARGVSAPVAARALQACGMLLAADAHGSPLSLRRTPGGEQLGLLLDGQCIRESAGGHPGASPC